MRRITNINLDSQPIINGRWSPRWLDHMSSISDALEGEWGRYEASFNDVEVRLQFVGQAMIVSVIAGEVNGLQEIELPRRCHESVLLTNQGTVMAGVDGKSLYLSGNGIRVVASGVALLYLS